MADHDHLDRRPTDRRARIGWRARLNASRLGAVTLVAMTALLVGPALAACNKDGSASADAPPKAPRVVIEKITLNDERFDLEVAADRDSIAKGLGGRESVADDGGMLFVFPDAQMRQFWMLDCVIDIDIIFVDSVGGVTAVHRMKADPQREGESRAAYEARLRRYSSVGRAQFAIELQAGSLDRLGIKPGDRLSHIDWRRIRRLAR